MKTPPLLLGAGLLFWGWQAGHLVEGALMAGLLEGAQSVKARWDFTDEDFRRIWTFCALLLLGAAIYAFTSAGGPGEFRGFLVFRIGLALGERDALSAQKQQDPEQYHDGL